MKKVFFNVMMSAFVAVLSVGFTSCSSDDAQEEQTSNVEVNLAEGSRTIIACRNAWTWLAGNGYVWTGEVKQIAYDFATAQGSTEIPALTTDELGQVPFYPAGHDDFFYFVAEVKDVINLCLNNGAQGINGPKQTAKWETGSLQGYEFKNAQTGDILYAWAGAHVIATNGYISTQHSGGELY